MFRHHDNGDILFRFAGFTVIGPNYIFGDSLDEIRAANPSWGLEELLEWGNSKYEIATKGFPQWLEAFKTKFG